MDKKLMVFTEAVRAVFMAEKDNPKILEHSRMPTGYLSKVCEILPDNFKWPKNKTGLSRYFSENKSAILNILKADKQPIKDNTQISLIDDIPKPSEPKKPISSEHRGYISEHDIILLINEQLDKRIADIKNSVQIEMNKYESPPPPETLKGPGAGRKENRVYDTITPTVDLVLIELLKKDVKKRRLSMGKELDQILWHWYGRPLLSYELPEAEREALIKRLKK